MKKIFYKTAAMFLAVLWLITSSACSGDDEIKKEYENNICKSISMSKIPEFSVVDTDNIINKNGDEESCYIISFEEKEATEFFSQISSTTGWESLPTHSEYYNMTDYNTLLPECSMTEFVNTVNELNKSGNAFAFFNDQSSIYEAKYSKEIKKQLLKISLDDNKSDSDSDNSKDINGKYSDEEPRIKKYAYDYSCAFYDKDEQKLYVYIFRRNYNEMSTILYLEMNDKNNT